MNRKDYVTNTGVTIDPATRINRQYVVDKLINEFNFKLAFKCYKLLYKDGSATLEILKACAVKVIVEAMDDPEEEVDRINDCFRVTKTCRVRQGYEETGKVYRFELAFQPIWSYSAESEAISQIESKELNEFRNSVSLAV